MKIVIQRVSSASVDVNNKVVGKINQGFLLFIGFNKNDNNKDIEKMVDKIINIRLFSDDNDKINLSLLDIKGEVLAISQFTLYAKIDGRRPSFSDAMQYDKAKEYYELFVDKIKEKISIVETGIFGENMKVNINNDGPVTIILESRDL